MMVCPNIVNNEMIESKPLRNGLLIAGISLTVVGIALNCIPHTAAVMTGNVCLTLGVPFLAVGIILAIYQKANEPRTVNNAEQQRSCFRNFFNRCRGGNRTGQNQELSLDQIRQQRLDRLAPDPNPQQE